MSPFDNRLQQAAEELTARATRGPGLNALEQRVLYAFKHASSSAERDTLDTPSLADLQNDRRQTPEDFAAELHRMRAAVGVPQGGRVAAEAINLRLPPDPVTARDLIGAIQQMDLSKLLKAGIQPAAAWDLDHTIFSGMSPRLIAPFLVQANPFRPRANARVVKGMLGLGVDWAISPDQLLRNSVAENLALVLRYEDSGHVAPLQRNALVAASLEGLTLSELAVIGDRFYREGMPGVEPPYIENLLGNAEEGTPADVIRTLEAAGVRNIIISAGFDFIAESGARAIDIPQDRVFATTLTVDERDELTGDIAFDMHRRGKAAFLETRFRPLLIAFGDSAQADGPVMDYALQGMMVDPGSAFYERKRTSGREYRVLHFADPARRLDPAAAGPLAHKYATVTGRNRGHYEGTTAHGIIRIPRRFDPEGDLERVIGQAERPFAVEGLQRGNVTPTAFLQIVNASIPAQVNRAIEEILVAAKRLATLDLAAPFPEQSAERDWLKWIMRFAWAHSRDNESLLHALGYGTAATGRHDFAETMGVGSLVAMLDARRATDGRLVEWVENLYAQVLKPMDSSDTFGIGIANPHLTVSFANWRPEAQTPAGWFHLTSDHHNGSSSAPIDPIEAGVNDFLHYLREHHFGVLKSTMKSFLDLGWLFESRHASQIAALMRSDLMARVVTDLAPLVKRFEIDGVITPWHLMDTRTEDVPLYVPRPTTALDAILPTIELLFAESFNTSYGTRRVRPGQLEAYVSSAREVTFRLGADEQLIEPFEASLRKRENVHYIGKYNPRNGELFAFEVSGFVPPLTPGLRTADS